MPTTHLITGATRGIGLALLRTLASRGNTVLATHRKPEDDAIIRDAGGHPLPLDVDSESSITDLGNRLSGRPIDVLINNAGINAPARTMADVKVEDALRLFRVNALAPLLVTRALLPSLLAGQRRIVAHISSIMGSIATDMGPGSYTYRTSKAALNMLNRCMSQELGPQGFACVVLHPGWVKTDMGGPNAPVSVDQSAAGLVNVIDALTPADNGRYLDYTGATLPW